MKLLQSKRVKLPHIYFITDTKEIKDVPIGIPFIFGDESLERHIIRVLEYEVIYQAAVKTGYPFDFKKLLTKRGYKDIEDFGYSETTYMDIKTDKNFDPDEEFDVSKCPTFGGKDTGKFKDFMRDSAAYVDITKLKELNVFPVWLDTIEEAVHTNIHNFATYNSNMYNKKLEGMYGGLEFSSPDRNLIIIDISGSIPRAVSSTCLALAQNLAETFYADLMITGSKTTVYDYSELSSLDVKKVYDDNGMDNDQIWFKKLVTGDDRKYKTVIAFGDNHSPSQIWSNEFNEGAKRISREDGQKMCKWKVDKLISFHTTSTDHIAGYADWFTPSEVEKIKDWVKYLN